MAGPRVQLPQFSMFTSTPIYILSDGNVTFGLRQPSVVPDDTDEQWIMPPGAVYRLDILASELYGTPALFWVLADVNDIPDPLVGPPAGFILRVPTKARLAAQGILNV